MATDLIGMIVITDNKLSEKLQLMPDLTLIKAVELVRQYEQVKEHISEQASSGAQLNEVAQRRQRQQHTDKERPKSGRNAKKFSYKQQTENTSEWKCKRCGRSHGKHDCPPKNEECRKYNKRGHFAVCRTRKVNDVSAPQEGAIATHQTSDRR